LEFPDDLNARWNPQQPEWSQMINGEEGLKLLTQAVATRQELIDVLALASAGKVHCEVETRPLSEAPASLAQLRNGNIVGRVVFVPKLQRRRTAFGLSVLRIIGTPPVRLRQSWSCIRAGWRRSAMA
jgi:hypothetical protein